MRLELEKARQEAATAERQHLAQVLHATVAQDLTAIYFTAKRMEVQLGGSHPETSSEVASLGEMVRRASGELLACMRALEAGALPPSDREQSLAHSGSSAAASVSGPSSRQPDSDGRSPGPASHTHTAPESERI